ncbi:hypothetical protein PF005_g2574 [Phytophthora fragariae]|uniref:Uncharacterized protein n=1 Tax=Phytophthora fragariae TaxID=53985 RepID=A0A6A4DIQ8_9STRA|nr:hypothetical protein PF003_g34927 [Phytophthora fragariae]KAE8936660.1 hypothetical protein PF009_g13420 [Phytophthora fragariae]KAE9007389.1 hypothetical protein PF011_g11142 [Phytophthora fragariae]KAE9109272.1 hypothetical protein PF010_g11608 [Phytophthora fragariae]KAE9111897.1 hypothetical protein PF007_g11309 [Phytophthora fragariae]
MWGREQQSVANLRSSREVRAECTGLVNGAAADGRAKWLVDEYGIPVAQRRLQPHQLRRVSGQAPPAHG